MLKPLDILLEYWGYSSFRPLQEDIIQSILQGKDTLALMPTGGGKSICFQVPALCQEGMCLVITPLIALMKDQVQQLKGRNISAEALYSGMSYKDIDRILDNAVQGHYKLLYISPERLFTSLFSGRLPQLPIQLLAVDEAHCISQWGYDFRPAYLKIGQIREILPNVPILALTATATLPVVKDIQEKLLFKEENVLQKSFERSNLSYIVLQENNKRSRIIELLRKISGSGIIYVRNRRKTKEMAQSLSYHNISADYYHAGLNMEQRSERQDRWINNQTRIMVATNAFGMGIDKPDVRIVIHWELPDGLEAYYQEAGRAGRDGKPSYAILLYNEGDRKKLLEQFEQSFPSTKEIQRVYRALGSYLQLATGGGKGQSYDFDLVDFSQNFKLKPIEVMNSLKILSQAGWISLSEAIFHPSTLKVIAEREVLYDYGIRNPKMDKVIKTILRSYQGASSQEVFLKEEQLARFLKISNQQLQAYLKKMAQAEIIRYRPQKDKPQLTFLKDRLPAENIIIDHQLLRFRKKEANKRLNKAFQYTEIPICRSQQLLKYFGQRNAKKCGQCDVCRGKAEHIISKDEFKQMEKEIMELIGQSSLNINELVNNFSMEKKDQVLRVTQFLLDEERIKIEEGKLFI